MTAVRSFWHLSVVILIGSAVLAACDTPGLTFVDPETTGSEDTPDTVHVQLEDSALAAALGWVNGVPNAEVQVHRFIDPFRPDTLYTDSVGHAILPNDLLAGDYRIAALRVLTAEEAVATGGTIRAFGDGFARRLPADTVQLTLDDRPGGLVISELYIGDGTLEIDYRWDQFVELYNNSDTTVYLDGMLYGSAYGHIGSGLPCEESRPWREDPLGLWALEFYQFPGSSTDYPVAPGQAVIVALDAADHSVVHPTLVDLSQADFELEGTADTDNPAVPNVRSVGPYSNLYGHGMLTMPTEVQFLALPVDVPSLETALVRNRRYARIPAARIMDVLDGDLVNLNAAPDLIPPYRCKWVNREFDRLESVYYRRGDNDNTNSIHRRILRVTPGNRVVLQDVNTTFLDFVVGTYSPGRIEY